jgi:thioredoxin-dependent peroxiredoxin
MRLKVGQPAKPFTATDIHGREVSLQEYSGQWVLVSFLRFVTCPRCSLRLYSLSLSYPDLQSRGLSVVAFVESSEDLILQRDYAANAPFPIIADPGQKYYRLYGVSNSRFGLFWGGWRHKAEIREAARLGFGQPEIVGNDYRMPADFIIDPQQRVQVAHYGFHSADTLSLEALQKSVPAPSGALVTTK